jgi:hypothetical protein
MIGDRVFQQNIEGNSYAVGTGRNVNVNRVDFLGIACQGSVASPERTRKAANCCIGPVGPCSPGIQRGYASSRLPGRTRISPCTKAIRRAAWVSSTTSFIEEADMSWAGAQWDDSHFDQRQHKTHRTKHRNHSRPPESQAGSWAIRLLLLLHSVFSVHRHLANCQYVVGGCILSTCFPGRSYTLARMAFLIWLILASSRLENQLPIPP